MLPSAVIALEFLTDCVGLPVINVWPAAGVVVALLGLANVGLLGWVAVRRPEERPRALGLFLFLGAMAAMAFGIGWGRSGFGVSEMGFTSRYALLAWPALAAVYFTWLRYGGMVASRWVPVGLLAAVAVLAGAGVPLAAVLLAVPLVGLVYVAWLLFGGLDTSRVVPAALFAVVAVMLPFNVATGWMIGEQGNQWWGDFEADVRAGMPPDLLVEKHFPNYSVAYRVRRGVRLLRDHGISYFPALKEGARIELPLIPDRLEHAIREGDVFRCESDQARLVYALKPPRVVYAVRAELSYLDRPEETRPVDYRVLRVFWTQPDGSEGDEAAYPSTGTGEQIVTVPVGRPVAELRLRPDQYPTVCRLRRLTLVVRGD